MHQVVRALAVVVSSVVCTAVVRGAVLARIEVVGHRGARAELPENIVPSFERAFAVGADAIELDVHETQDGVIVVHHDDTVNFQLCTQVSGPPIAPRTPIRALTFAQLQQLDCGAKTDPHFPQQRPSPGAKIPRLVDALLVADDHAGRVYVEVKRADDDTTPPEKYAGDVVDAIHRVDQMDRVVLMTFDPALLAALRKAAPRAPIGFLFEPKADGDLVQRTVAAGAQIVAAPVGRVDRALVLHAHAVGVRVVAWTANRSEEWRALALAGVDGIITDDPRGLVESHR